MPFDAKKNLEWVRMQNWKLEGPEAGCQGERIFIWWSFQCEEDINKDIADDEGAESGDNGD